MNPRMFPWVGLVVLLIGLAPEQCRAQEGARNALHSFNGPDNAYGPDCAGTAKPPRGWYPCKKLLRDPLCRPSLLRCVSETCCCWASPNTLGAGNLKTECLFVFGSSRAFFGEPCLNGPPPPVSPPGTAVGYYPPPEGCRHCPK